MYMVLKEYLCISILEFKWNKLIKNFKLDRIYVFLY